MYILSLLLQSNYDAEMKKRVQSIKQHTRSEPSENYLVIEI